MHRNRFRYRLGNGDRSDRHRHVLLKRCRRFFQPRCDMHPHARHHIVDLLPGARDIESPEHREYIASVWGCDADDIPGRGLSAQEIMQAIHAGEIKGLLSICFNPVVSLPDSNFTAEALDRLEFFGVVDFFLSETAFHADVVLPGSLHEEDEGIVCTAEGRVVKINAAVDRLSEVQEKM